MSAGVHDFEIPHEFALPTRDMVIIRMPLPPKYVGSIEIPAMARDLMQHNVSAGRIVAMGPLAFHYKDGKNELTRQDINIGDWVVIRPFAGTLLQGGKLESNGGWRYVSSFNDVIAILPADKMPAANALRWEDDDKKPLFDYRGPQQPHEPLPETTGVRERVVYKK